MIKTARDEVTCIKDGAVVPLIGNGGQEARQIILRDHVGNLGSDLGIPVSKVLSADELAELYPMHIRERTCRLGTYQTALLGSKLPLLTKIVQEQTGSRNIVIETSEGIVLDNGTTIHSREVCSYPHYFAAPEISSIDKLSAAVPRISRFESGGFGESYKGIELNFYKNDSLDETLVAWGETKPVARVELKLPLFRLGKRMKLYFASRLEGKAHQKCVQTIREVVNS